jgi:biotin carboxyl carrier protein
MEAMKMEYTLSADIDGRVEVLTAQVGAQVGLQVALVQLRGSE